MSTHKTRPLPNGRNGFTLVEILIVLAIIATVLAIGLPAIERVTQQRTASAARKFVGLVRSMRNDSILLSSIHRLNIDLEKAEWIVEEQKEHRAIQDSKGRSGDSGSGNFEPAEKYSKKATPLPSGTQFLGIMKEGEGLVQQGRVMIHFFPNGYNEGAILYLGRTGDKNVSFSIKIPVTGKVELLPGAVQTFQ